MFFLVTKLFRKHIFLYMEEKKSIWNRTWFIVIIATICCLLWGSAFPCIKIGYKLFNISGNSSSSQILFAGIRFALSGIMVILAGSIIFKKFLFPNSLKSLLYCIFLSLFQTIGQYVFFYIGLAHTSGSNGAIVEATNTFFTILWACLIFKTEKISFWKMAGCFVGFSGVCLIELHGTNLADFKFNFLGDGFVLISCLLASFVPSLLKLFSKFESPFVLSGYQFLFGGIIMAVLALVFGGRIENPVSPASAYSLLIYLAFISACAYTLWSLLMKVNDVSKVAVFGFINPVFGFILSALILGESNTAFSLTGILSLFLVSLGIVLVYVKKSKKNLESNNSDF